MLGSIILFCAIVAIVWFKGAELFQFLMSMLKGIPIHVWGLILLALLLISC